jgi:hypothetical protein
VPAARARPRSVARRGRARAPGEDLDGRAVAAGSGARSGALPGTASSAGRAASGVDRIPAWLPFATPARELRRTLCGRRERWGSTSWSSAERMFAILRLRSATRPASTPPLLDDRPRDRAQPGAAPVTLLADPQQVLADLWRAAALEPVQTRAIEVPIVFTDGSWSPFPGGQVRRAAACRWPRRARRGCARQHQALTTSPDGHVF